MTGLLARLAALVLIVSIPCHVTFAIDDHERVRIEALLARIAKSNVTFVRNGAPHTAMDAAAHLRMKWENAGNRIKTAEDFIEHLASRSYLSGKPYRVILCNGVTQDSGPWLRELLAEIDRTRP
jgi:hypothetical protein